MKGITNMFKLDIDEEEVRQGYSAFLKLLLNFPIRHKLLLAKELFRIGRLIASVHLCYAMHDCPKKRTKKSRKKEGEKTTDGES